MLLFLSRQKPFSLECQSSTTDPKTLPFFKCSWGSIISYFISQIKIWCRDRDSFRAGWSRKQTSWTEDQVGNTEIRVSTQIFTVVYFTMIIHGGRKSLRDHRLHSQVKRRYSDMPDVVNNIIFLRNETWYLVMMKLASQPLPLLLRYVALSITAVIGY